jgi:hypothetical protein
MLNGMNLKILFDSDEVRFDVRRELIPYLVFDYVITTHQFNPSPYYRELSNDRKKLHNKVMELHNKGWGYTKIHTYLRKNGFEIGKSRQTVNTMIKKMKKRDEFYHQSIMDGYGNFRVEWREV